MRCLLLAALALGTAVRAAGQAVGAFIGADAVVVTVGMTVTTLRNLDFGAVPKGVATTVAPNAPTAGAWQVTGNANAFVLIQFTLPTSLANTQAVPGITMPISFGAASARARRAVNDPNGAAAFNPNFFGIGRFGPPPNPTLYVWLGGTVNPSPAQLPGVYTGNIIVTLTYL